MIWDTRWEPYPDMQVHEQVSKLVEELLGNADKDLNLATWVPVVDLRKLRPN
jgi:hypothetical protein